MGAGTKEVVMPGDSDYIERGIKEASLHANGEAALEEQEAADIFDDDARELWPNRGGGEYHVVDVGRLSWRAGHTALSADFGTNRIMPRRQEMPRIIGRSSIPKPEIGR
jgi:hypothetical protein